MGAAPMTELINVYLVTKWTLFVLLLLIIEGHVALDD